MMKVVLTILVYFSFLGSASALGLVGPDKSSKEERVHFQNICLNDATGERRSLTGFNEELMGVMLHDRDTKGFLWRGSLSGAKNISESDDGVLRPGKSLFNALRDEKVTNRFVYCLLTSGYRWEDSDKSGIDEIKTMAIDGNASAQATLGVMYYEGRGVTQNYSEGADWLIRAANSGYANAQYNLSIAYGQGNGVAIDIDEAIIWMEKAASQGHAAAKRALPMVKQEQARLANSKLDKDVSVYLSAAESGNPEAMFRYGMLFEDGTGVARNMDEAIKWYHGCPVKESGGIKKGLNSQGIW
ncbi:tetratricopeptide repeat protein [Mariprofundus ferrooxydans]|uniref:tetratricopeptide repeat protein n=1 Tax=Mariprofundus ferrooxydans TaxID=314344 RepID=UPI0006A6BC2D|nr:tetratricopeptide repeat protein [Mariprofundus ferrooxydans]KON46833.1 hypothetical protein AL013_11510 [Mariprofundus ferrooxydans]